MPAPEDGLCPAPPARLASGRPSVRILAAEPPQRRRREQGAPLVLALAFALAGVPAGGGADRHAGLPDGGKRHTLPPSRQGLGDDGGKENRKSERRYRKNFDWMRGMDGVGRKPGLRRAGMNAQRLTSRRRPACSARKQHKKPQNGERDTFSRNTQECVSSQAMEKSLQYGCCCNVAHL